MKIRFNKLTTVEYHPYPDFEEIDKTFAEGEVVEVEYIDDTVRGFVDIHFVNRDVAIGVSTQGLTIL